MGAAARFAAYYIGKLDAIGVRAQAAVAHTYAYAGPERRAHGYIGPCIEAYAGAGVAWRGGWRTVEGDGDAAAWLGGGSPRRGHRPHINVQ